MQVGCKQHGILPPACVAVYMQVLSRGSSQRSQSRFASPGNQPPPPPPSTCSDQEGPTASAFSAGSSPHAGFPKLHAYGGPIQDCKQSDEASGLPPIPGYMVQAIKTRKYVGLADLLLEALREMQFDEAIETIAKKKKFTISSTLVWTVAFLTYMTVTSHFDPSWAFVLSAYQSIVLNLARDMGGQAWLSHDKVFRQAAAVNPGLD